MKVFFLFIIQHWFFFRWLFNVSSGAFFLVFVLFYWSLSPLICPRPVLMLCVCLCIWCGPFCSWPRGRRMTRRMRKMEEKFLQALQGLFAFLFMSLPVLTGGWRVSSSPLFGTGASKPAGNHRLRNSTKHTHTHRVKHARRSRSGCHRHTRTDGKMRCLSWWWSPSLDGWHHGGQSVCASGCVGDDGFLCCMLRPDVRSLCSILHQIIHGKQNKAQSQHGFTLSSVTVSYGKLSPP